MGQDSRGIIDYHDLKFLLIFISVMSFFLGLMLADYGASFKGMDDMVDFQSLAFGDIDARIVYHSGLLFIVCAFLTMSALAFHCVTKLVRVS